jgi:PAS domain S-box-containing protein
LNAASEWRWIHAWIVVFATTSDLKVSQILGVAHDITGRKQAENTVRWAEDRYRRLFEEAPLMYINLQDQAGIPIITECNQAFLYALGYTFAEVLGHPVSDFYAPESRVALLESGGYRRALERHFTAEERTLVTHDGRVIYTMLTAVPETDMQGNVIGTRAMYVDITERKQVEENLRRSESSLAEAQRLSQLGSWDWNLRTNAISCSEEMCRLVGRTPSEIDLTPEAFAKFLPPNEAERVLLKFESVPADQPFFSIEHRLIRSNGELRAAVSQVKVYRDENGTPLRLLGSTQDITARHLAELSLRKLSSALEQTADLVLITDRNGLIEYVNPAFEQLTGYSLAEVIGQTPRIIKSGRMSAKFHESLWNTLLAGQIYRGELVNKKKNGELYYEEKTITPIRDSESTITHFISTGKDVTERKRVQAQIQRYTNQLEALNQLAQITVTSLDQETVLNNIATAIQSLMRCQQAYVLIPDGADLVIAAVAGGNDKLRGFHIPIATSIAGRVYTMGESIQSSVDKASEREAVFQELDKLRSFRGRSVVAAPIQIGQRVAGVLEAVHSTRDAYDEDDRRLLDAASNWAAIAIENARQHGVTLRRWRESDALVRISRALNETMHLPRVLQMIADAAQQIIPTVEHTVIHLLDGEQNALRSMAVAGLHQLRREEFTMRSGEGAAGLAIAQQMVVNIRDTRSDPRYLPIGNAVHLKSLLVAPIQIAARPLGTISVQSVIIGAFSADDERLLEAFASNAAIAIENARLFEMERRQRDEAITLQWIAQAINSRLDLPGLLQAAAAALSEMANYDQVVVVFLEPEGWRVMARQSIDTETLPDFIPADSVREYGAAHSGQAGLVPSLLAEPVWARLMPGMQALVHAPIWMQNRVKGFVAVGAREQHSLGDRDVELLAGVGRQLGVAIENVMLYSDLSFSLEQEHDMRAQLIQAAKLGALGRLTASLAHEINNPLQSIQGCLTLAIEELETHKRSEKISRYLGVAEGEIGRISAIVRNMRDFYRPAGSDFKPTDIHLILQGVLELTNKQLQQGLIKFRRIWTEDLPMIEAVPDHLRQVFLNLVLNAVDGMPEGGMLTISSTVSQIKYSGQQGSIPAIQVEVADTGRGMSADTLSHLFEPFFTTKEQGSGLGLSISYRIVQAHSGFISAASEEGHGSVFTVLLPISQTLKLSETANE